jgi:hypothetical protein
VSSGAELLIIPAGVVVVGGALLAGRALDAAAGALGGAADAMAARQQLRAQARARLDRAYTEFAALAARVQAEHGRQGSTITPPPTPPPRPGDLDDAVATVAEIGRLAAAVEERLRAELAAVRTAAVLAGLTEDLAALRDDAVRAADRATPAPARQRPLPIRADLADTVRRVFQRLDSGVSPREWEEISGRARAVLTARPESTRLLVDDLRYSVQLANGALTARRDRLADLHERLGRFDGAAVEAARRSLYGAADDPEPDWPGLERAVHAAIDEAAAAANAAYVSQALAESLAEIGCEVQEGFDTLLVHGGIAHLRPAGLGEFAVRVRTQADGALRFNMVTASAGELDEETERAWCSKLDELVPVLDALGLRVEVRERSDIGATGAQRIAPARFPFEVAEHEVVQGEVVQGEVVEQADAAQAGPAAGNPADEAAQHRRRDRGRDRPAERSARPR